ncbi:MAG TPA: hypothetical protein VJV79_24115 [Polyangiaceae bacterium]|nr:hypothetical protein [Polyangiaceae bacterium]
MVELRFRRLCAALAFLLLCACLSMASCSTPEFKFVDNSQPAHCKNQQRDEGESDIDCGGACTPCALTQLCNTAADCRDGECIDGTCQAASCADGNQTENETDVDCGGGSCKTCPVGGSCVMGSDCQTGVCGEQGCAEAACDDRVINGDESDIDCGGPAPECARCVAGQSCLTPSDCVGNECNAGTCAISCAAGTANCDGKPENLCETNLRTDADHCGDCATACSLSNAAASCVGGVCRVESCTPPFADCNGQPADGCEVNTKTDVANCGACAAKPCPSLNGQAYCADSTCGLTCAENFADCDGKAGNGCEKDVSRDIGNCGGCDKACTAGAGKTAWCRNGQCGETTCAAGRGDCNGNPDDDPAHGGCETDLQTDVLSCGACGTTCGISGGEAQCSAGSCSIKTCSPGLADCTGGYADGCETNSNTDVDNCGTCTNACSVANGSPLCLDGECEVKGCTGTFADCNGNASDGCETNTSTSQTHCGACTGVGTNCDSAFANASGQCVSGVCGLKMCATNYSNCDGMPSNGCESNLKTDPKHCGTCTISCSGAGSTGPNCAAGICSPQCTGTLISCSNPQNGCVIDSATDENNCGGCGKICNNTASAHVDAAGNQCLAKVCTPSCASLYDDCDTDRGNGCERSVAADIANCGACNVTCGTANIVGSPTCGGGKCTSQCQAGWAKCGAPAAGCDTPLGTVSNCAACGNACTGATTLCSPGVGCVAHFDIGVVGTPITAKKGFEMSVVPELTANHVLSNSKASGRSRIVLVGVTTTEWNAMAVTMKYVWYNGVLMHRALEVNSNELGSYAGIYYLLDSELPAMPGTYAVKAQFSSTAQNGVGAFTVSEFQNVRQAPSPFVTTVAAPSDANCNVAPTRGVTLSFTQGGSFGYVVVAARQASAATATPGTVSETMKELQNQPLPLMGLAGYVGPINGNSTPSWTVSNCSNTAGVGVVLKRVGD